MEEDPREAVTLPAPAASAGDPPALGARCGRFVVERMLGTGGMGVVLLATDPELGRKVAIKLLLPEAATAAAADRLVREAQAMARLSHPNVVTVYEVGRADDQVFIAMELVEGETLRAWMRTPRPWREAVAMFVAFGRGLAVAHDAGLVHRDVKPDNVLVGRDGRPRITDFGLVSSGHTPDASAIAADAIQSGLTIRGSAIGTPAYMSNEQWSGGDVDARSDQFSFCVALWEAVYGRRPFAGATAVELAAAIGAGAIMPPPAGHDAPAWLEAALRRGLALDPAARWPSLAALLDELAARLADRRRATIVAAGGAGVLGLGVVAAAIALGGAAPDPCPAPGARAAAIWSPARRAALATSIAAVDPELGAARFAAAAGVFDRGVAAWTKEHVAACRATRVEGRKSEAVLDARTQCLDHWLAQAGKAIARLEQVKDRKGLDAGVASLFGVPLPTACDDENAPWQPPVGDPRREEALAIGREVQALADEVMTDPKPDLADRAAALIERARKLEHPALLARVMRWTLEAKKTSSVDDAPALIELTKIAAIAGDDRAAAWAWIRLVMVHGFDNAHPEQGEAMIASAEAALLRAKDPPHLRFDLQLARAAVLRRAGRAAEGAPFLDAAAATVAGATDDQLPLPRADYEARVAFARALMLEQLGRRVEAIDAYEEAKRLKLSFLGPDHPNIAQLLINVGETYQAVGRLDESLAAYQDALRIAEARTGESSLTALALDRLATAFMSKAPAKSVEYARRAFELGAKKLPPTHPHLIAVRINLAAALASAGRIDESITEVTAVIEADSDPKRWTENTALSYANRAELHTKQHRLDAALADYRTALDILDRVKTGERYRASITTTYGGALLDAKRPREAAEALDRAQAALTADDSPLVRAELRFQRGRALVETKRDRKTGLAEAIAARADAVAAAAKPEQLASYDRWLAARGVSSGTLNNQ
jgi:eukaryotic-like serine/threonine-protein kinase